MPFLGVRYNILDLLLRIKPVVRYAVADIRSKVAVLHRLRPLRPDLGQLRIFLYLDPPTLIVRQMPMKIIELVLRHLVDELFNKFNRLKVTRYVEMHSAIAKTWFV